MFGRSQSPFFNRLLGHLLTLMRITTDEKLKIVDHFATITAMQIAVNDGIDVIAHKTDCTVSH